jgi:hypothetical protein
MKYIIAVLLMVLCFSQCKQRNKAMTTGGYKIAGNWRFYDYSELTPNYFFEYKYGEVLYHNQTVLDYKNARLEIGDGFICFNGGLYDFQNYTLYPTSIKYEIKKAIEVLNDTFRPADTTSREYEEYINTYNDVSPDSFILIQSHYNQDSIVVAHVICRDSSEKDFYMISRDSMLEIREGTMSFYKREINETHRVLNQIVLLLWDAFYP